MELGHLLTRSGLTYLEVSSEVFHDSSCQLGNSVSLSWVVCREAFCLHVVWWYVLLEICWWFSKMYLIYFGCVVIEWVLIFLLFEGILTAQRFYFVEYFLLNWSCIKIGFALAFSIQKINLYLNVKYKKFPVLFLQTYLVLCRNALRVLVSTMREFFFIFLLKVFNSFSCRKY